MAKRQTSKLEEHAEELDAWFDDEEFTLAMARERLAKSGCAVSLPQLSKWRQSRGWERLSQQLVEQITAAARHCQQVEQEFGKNPPPELETLIKLHRVLILQLGTQTDGSPEATRLLTALMKPVMDWARLQEQRNARLLAEQKYRDEVEARNAALERELKAAKNEGGLSLETLEKIERELKLM